MSRRQQTAVHLRNIIKELAAQEKTFVRANVVRTSPLTLESLDATPGDPLYEEEDDFSLTVGLRRFHEVQGLLTGDTVLLHREAGQYHAFDVLTDRNIDVGAVPLGSSSAHGRVRLSVEAVDPGDPVAVGDNDPRLTAARPPTGAAGGDLAGTYPNPTIKASVALTGTPSAPSPGSSDNSTRLATTAFVHAVADAVTAIGGAGGDLTGSYPSPSIAAGAVTNAKVSATAAIAYSKLSLSASIVHGDIALANIDGLPTVPSMRTLGTTAQSAAAGNDVRLRAAIIVDGYVRNPGETDDTGKMQRAANDAASQGRPLMWYAPLTIDGVTIPSNSFWAGPGKLIVGGTQPFPLYGPPGTHDVRWMNFEIDGNKAAIAGNPDVIGNPSCAAQFDGTTANPCQRIYVNNVYVHDSKRLGLIFVNVQGGHVGARVAHNERDGVTFYYNCRDITFDLTVQDCGDDYLGINSGEGSTVGLCERLAGRLRATGPSTRAKGRAMTIRGGNDIRVDLSATNVSQSGVWLSTWPGAPLTNIVLNDLQVIGAGTGGGAVDKDGVHFEVSDTDYIRDVHLNGGLVKGSVGWGIKFVNAKSSPADGDISGIYINGVPVFNSGGSGIGASGAHAVDHLWLTDSPVRGSLGDGIVFDGAMTEVHVIDSPAYANVGWGIKMRVIVGGSLRGSPASGNGNGINIALLSGTFDYNDSPAWGNTTANVQDDGGHAATWVAAGRPDGPAAGDLGGTYPNPTVAKLGQNSTRYGQGADLNSFAAEYAHVRSNYIGVTDRLMNTAKPSWTMVLDGRAGVDRFAVVRAPATTGSPADADVLSLSSAGVLNVAGYQQGGAALASTHLSDSAQLARLAGPTFTGTVTIPTAVITTLSGNPNFSGAPTLSASPATADNSTALATTAFVKAQAYAPLASPAFTGTATANILRVQSGTANDISLWSDGHIYLGSLGDTNAYRSVTNSVPRLTTDNYLFAKGPVITSRTSAPADADLAAGELAIWFDKTTGAAKLMVKAKDNGGTVRTGSLALT